MLLTHLDSEAPTLHYEYWWHDSGVTKVFELGWGWTEGSVVWCWDVVALDETNYDKYKTGQTKN